MIQPDNNDRRAYSQVTIAVGLALLLALWLNLLGAVFAAAATYEVYRRLGGISQ